VICGGSNALAIYGFTEKTVVGVNVIVDHDCALDYTVPRWGVPEARFIP
jgi:hypothetical protein